MIGFKQIEFFDHTGMGEVWYAPDTKPGIGSFLGIGTIGSGCALGSSRERSDFQRPHCFLISWLNLR